MNDPASAHFGQWGSMLVWIALFAVMLVFVPFYKKSQWKPTSAYLAFIVALAFEMFGIPLSMYALTWAFGIVLPDGVLFGHTLNQWIGPWGMVIGTVMIVVGLGLVIVGWSVIHKRYWSHEAGEGQLVNWGIYGLIRHPQYSGFMLVTLGMMFDWLTLPLLLMWPLLFLIYYRLARREEREMEAEFGDAYRAYKARTGMFLPKLWGRPTERRNSTSFSH